MITLYVSIRKLFSHRSLALESFDVRPFSGFVLARVRIGVCRNRHRGNFV